MRMQIRNVHLTYGTTQALNDVSLTLEGDRIIGLLGRNGSGKSSLLSLVAAFRKPNDGEITLNDEPIFENAAMTSQIALIREGGDVIDEDEKVSEAFRYAAWLRPNWDQSYADSLLEQFQVPVNTKLGDMSRGQRSAVGVALGLASRAPITIFDETYLGMDAPSRYSFYDMLLQDYVSHPRMFILSTHLIEEVARLFEEVVIIDKGNVLLHRPTEDLLNDGLSITGPAAKVDQVTAGLQLIGSRDLGPTRAVTVFGGLDAEKRRQARAAGLDLTPLPLQDLFVHLTAPTSNREGVAS